MGEFRVHHARFFEYIPNAIHCMAYEDTQQKLAISRSDGMIEIWSVKDNWYQERTLVPSEGRSVEALIWCGTRLFSAGLHGDLLEHDLLSGKIKQIVSSNSGPIWCLAVNDDHSKIAAGTEDGCIVLYEVTNHGFDYLKALDKQEGRILSIAWFNPENLIVTGGIDNIRVWSTHSGHALQRFTLPRQEHNKETIVWAIAVTDDFTVISGDSRGKTSFWNGRQGTLIKAMHSHKADVLCVCVNKAGDSVFSSGIDPTLTQFEYIPATLDSDWKMWVRSSTRSQHFHDVRALAMTKESVVSAGVDCQLIINPLREKKGGGRIWRRIAPIPHTPLVHSTKKSHIVVLRYTDYIELWKLGTTNKHSDKSGDILKLSSRPVKLLQLKSRGAEHIVCCAISDNGQWLAYSDQETLRIFQMSLNEDGVVTPEVSLNRIRYKPPGVLPSHTLTFTPDGSTLISATTDGTVQLIKMDAIQPSLISNLEMPNDKKEAIHLLSVCPKQKYLAVGDHGCNLHIFNIQKKKHLCSLPRMSNQPTSLAFSPTGDEIVVAYSDQKIYEYSITQREYTDWSKTLSQNFHPQWLHRHSKLTQILYNQHNPSQIFVRDEQMFCIIDKSQPLPAANEKIFDHKHWSKDRERHKQKHAYHLCTKFKYLMHIDVLEDDFLLVVERPPMSIRECLPDTLKVKKFGT